MHELDMPQMLRLTGLGPLIPSTLRMDGIRRSVAIILRSQRLGEGTLLQMARLRFHTSLARDDRMSEQPPTAKIPRPGEMDATGQRLARRCLAGR
jgi:hypothetical protein